MKRAAAILAVLGVVAIVCADIDNIIVQHNPNLRVGEHYAIDQGDRKITLLQGVPSEVFEFEAVLEDGGQYVGPGDIDLVTAEENAGEVVLTFVGHNGHEYGAANIMEIRLNQPGLTGIIQELNISNNLGDLGPVLTERIEGACTVQREITNDIVLQSLFGEVDSLTMQDLTVTDATPGPIGTRIVIRGGPPYSHTIDVAGDIEYVSMSPTLTGTIHTGGDLLEFQVIGRLDGALDIGGDLYSCLVVSGSIGPINVGGDIEGLLNWASGDFASDVTVQGDIARDGQIFVNVGSMSGAIDVWNDFRGSLACHLGSLSGPIRVRGDFLGQIDLWARTEDPGELSSDIVVDGNFFGRLGTLYRGMSGHVTIGGNMGGTIAVGSAAEPGSEPDFTGSVTVGQNMTGVISVAGNLHDPTDPNDPGPQLTGGHIIINGSFGTQYLSVIKMGGTMTGPRPFIAVDYDGWHEQDSWNYACVKIGSEDDPEYYWGNTPAMHIWEVTRCKADLNNDGVVDFGDINPVVLALSNPDAYALEFPGLGGSMVFHGDLNCDGYFNIGDVNPLTARIIEGCCWEECGTCPSGLGQNLSAPELALKLATAVRPDLYDSLVYIAEQTAKWETDPKVKAYWNAVHKALGG